MRKITLLGLLICLMCSCAPKKNIIYFNGVNNSQTIDKNEYLTKLQPDDILSIIVNSDSELVKDFNLMSVGSQVSEASVSSRGMQTYLIDKNGYIDFPQAGKIKIGGLTKEEAIKELTQSIEPYIKGVTFNIRILNYKITVLGEVTRPNTYNFDSERITLLQALGTAGDLTIYGNRKSVLIQREIDGKRTYNRIDITKPDFVNSDFYYLHQNDVIYVEPNKPRVNTSAVGPNITVAISVVSLLITIFVVLTR